MSTELDLDDGVHGHPTAQVELTELRQQAKRLQNKWASRLLYRSDLAARLLRDSLLCVGAIIIIMATLLLVLWVFQADNSFPLTP